jgi:uncharacterized protein (DUF1778 family)
MAAKTQQLQIRVTRQQKTALKKLARSAGRDLSSYVLSRLVPAGADRFADLLHALQTEADRRYVLAELTDFLQACPPVAFAEAVTAADLGGLSSYLRNYVAAMVEQAAESKQVAPPAWVADVTPLDTPRFATPMRSLRMYLLHASPVPFKRRNIFIDAAVGARV